MLVTTFFVCRREEALKASHKPTRKKVKVDWIVKDNEGLAISVMESKPTGSDLQLDFVKLVREGVDISNSNLERLGVEPVFFPLIQAQGKFFSSLQCRSHFKTQGLILAFMAYKGAGKMQYGALMLSR
jgi:hypothetical protein